MKKLIASIAAAAALTLAKPFEYLYYGGDYDQASHNPKYTHYVLTASQVQADVASRDSMKFWQDDTLGTMKSSDYAKFGFDRGHMVPAEDMDYSERAMFQTFSMANIAPQVKELNRGPWRKLEKCMRDSALKYGSISIWTGPLYRGTKQVSRGIAIPSHFFKVMCRKKGGCAAFVYPNANIKVESIDSMQVPIKALSKEIGIKFK